MHMPHAEDLDTPKAHRLKRALERRPALERSGETTALIAKLSTILRLLPINWRVLSGVGMRIHLISKDEGR